MPDATFAIPNEGHTLGGLIRDGLFEHGAEFAACTVPHPQDTFLQVTVSHPEDCLQCVLASLRDARTLLEKYRAVVQSNILHEE